MDEDYMNELQRWRTDVDGFIAESGLYRRSTQIRMDSMEKNLEKNTDMTTDMHSSLSTALPVLSDLRGFARTVKRLGSFLKPLAWMAAPIAAIVVYIKTGEWHITWP
jgi:hypothetical protein